MNQQRCTGWWEQDYLGRQPMEGLMIQIHEGKITGSGYDMVGSFTFEGTVDENQNVLMHKHYLGQHQVVYKGEYDGNNLLWGIWSVNWMTGAWEIRLRDAEAEKAKAAEKSVIHVVIE